MDFDNEAWYGIEEPLDKPALPKHLAGLVGALQGPADLGVHHDRRLADTAACSSSRKRADEIGPAEAGVGHR
ncbi:hypothetical protein ACFYOK_30375 [Microbispora bryophytorum]|uniref:hypothetical protein n=1 Tax=Microbispora bryophytorum TaxID=1460882 RepID=UPI0033D62A18